MKTDFVVQARAEGFTNRAIAKFMDYTEASASELYTTALAGEDRFEWQKMLTRILEGETITTDDFPGARAHAKKIKQEGYHIFKSPEGYRI